MEETMSQQNYRKRLKQRRDTVDGGGVDATFTPSVGRVTTAQQTRMAGNTPPPAPPEPKEQITPEQAGDVPPVTQQPVQTPAQAVAGAEEAIAQAAQEPTKPELLAGTPATDIGDGPQVAAMPDDDTPDPAPVDEADEPADDGDEATPTPEGS
jgi:hypothetical protein